MSKKTSLLEMQVLELSSALATTIEAVKLLNKRVTEVENKIPHQHEDKGE